MGAHLAVGLMSGTSVDGIDAALVRIHEDNRFELVHFATYPFDQKQRDNVLALCQPETSSVDQICATNMDLGFEFAKAACRVVQEGGHHLSQIDFIGSHGQTIYHIPGHSTLQIGEPAVIANVTGVVTVGDFRPADMAWDGQGAPLVPYFDQLVLGRYAPLAVQNIGGIGNVTVVAEYTTELPAIAFDTGPGNMVIDGVVDLLTHGRQQYDKDGELAAKGEVNHQLLCEMMQHPYFPELPPKTTGRERFGYPYVRELISRLDLPLEDLVATVTAFTAHSIVDQYKRFVFPYLSVQQVVVGGGGSYNPTLLRMLTELLEIPVVTHEEFGIASAAKEAIAFALMARATLSGQPNNVPRATGAKRPVILGKVCFPAPELL